MFPAHTVLTITTRIHQVLLRRVHPVLENSEGAACEDEASVRHRRRRRSHLRSARPTRKQSIRGMLETRKPASTLSTVLCRGRRMFDLAARDLAGTVPAGTIRSRHFLSRRHSRNVVNSRTANTDRDGAFGFRRPMTPSSPTQSPSPPLPAAHFIRHPR